MSQFLKVVTALLLVSTFIQAAAEEEVKATLPPAFEPEMIAIPGKHYAMGKYHVTRGQFADFVSETGYDAGNACWMSDGERWEDKSGYNWQNPGYTQDDSHPVTCVNWEDANAYTQWLSRKTNKQYRLPSVDEWKTACDGGTAHTYCGSDDIDSVAWHLGNSDATTHPVGQKQANGYGLYDMSGNVWQWVANQNNKDPGERAIRGGSWDLSPQYVWAASLHGSGIALNRDNSYGFRVVRTLP